MTERRGMAIQSAEEFEEQLFAAWPRPRRVAMLREREAAIRAAALWDAMGQCCIGCQKDILAKYPAELRHDRPGDAQGRPDGAK